MAPGAISSRPGPALAAAISRRSTSGSASAVSDSGTRSMPAARIEGPYSASACPDAHSTAIEGLRAMKALRPSPRFRIATAPGSRAANRCPIRPYPTMP
jgi:hypothetical protein